MYSRLPERAEDLKSAVINVSLEDVECVSVTTVKVRGPPKYLQLKKGADRFDQLNVAVILKTDPVQEKLAEEEFTAKYSDWKSEDWNELEWDMVKQLEVRELLTERRKMAQVVENGQCLGCPDFPRHVSSLPKLPAEGLTLIQASSPCNMTSGLSRKTSWL